MALPVQQQTEPQSVAKLREDLARPRNEIARLALLHDEARETALLANLLGRTPYVAGALLITALAVVFTARGATPPVELAVWLLLVLIAAGAMMRMFRRAITAPFERGNLREFASDLQAIMAYAGFAWGAGAYLALGLQTSPLMLTAFAVVVPALVAATLRSRTMALGFLAAAAGLSAFAAVLRPLPEGPLAAAFVLIAGALVGGAIFWADRLSMPAPMAGKLTDFPLPQP